MSARQLGIASGLTLALVACPEPQVLPPSPPLGDSAFVALVGASSVVFVGTVVALPGRTTDAVPMTPRTAVVRVDSLVNWAPAVDIAPGESVTVVLRNTTLPALKSRYAFLGNGVAVDSGVVLEETARYAAESTALVASFLTGYGDAVPRAVDRETYDHLREIGLVAWGPVTAVAPVILSAEVARRNRSESAPNWWVATIVPRRVLRGDTMLVSRPQRVFYPSSRHMIYASVPRPRDGDIGVYLLHRPAQFAELFFAGIDTAGAFVIFDTLDVRPSGDTTRVADLLKKRP